MDKPLVTPRGDREHLPSWHLLFGGNGPWGPFALLAMHLQAAAHCTQRAAGAQCLQEAGGWGGEELDSGGSTWWIMRYLQDWAVVELMAGWVLATM